MVGTSSECFSPPTPADEGGCSDATFAAVAGGMTRALGGSGHFMPPSLLASQLATLEPPYACRFTAIRVDGAGTQSSRGEGGGLAESPSACRSADTTSAGREAHAVTRIARPSVWALGTQGGGDAAAVVRGSGGDAAGATGAMIVAAAADSILLHIAPAEADTSGATGGAAFPSVAECVQLIMAAQFAALS